MGFSDYMDSTIMSSDALTKIYYGNSLYDWLISLAIVLAAFIVGKAVYWVLGNLVKSLTSRTKTKLDDIIVDKVEEPIVFAIIIFGIWYAISLLNFTDAITGFIAKTYRVLITLNITWLVSRLFQSIYQEYIAPIADKTDTDFDDQILPLVRKGVTIIIWTLGIIVALDNAGYKIGPLLAGLGIGGLAFALAAKDTVANIFGGFTIFADKPFKLKDRIKIGDFDGFVEEIGLRSTRLRTLAGTLVTIPNSEFSQNAVENVTLEPTRKISLSLGLTYDTTPQKMEKAMKILESISKKHKELIDDKYKISFTDFGDFSLGITYLYYIRKDADIFGTQNTINLEILKEFNKEKLSFAFPTQTIELTK